MRLYKRGKYFHYDFGLAGRRYRGSTDQETAVKARRFLTGLLATIAGGGAPLTQKTPRLRDFSGRFFSWVENGVGKKGKLSANTRRYYRNGWKLIDNTRLAALRLGMITQEVVDNFNIGLSPYYENQARRTLRRMLSKAREWKLIRELPRIALEEEYGREVMIDGETEKLLLAAAVQPCHDIIIIVQDTGMRPEREVLPMRWEYVDWSNKRYFVYSSKTRAGRRFVPISDRMERVLLSRFAGQKSGWIFPSKKSSSGHLTTVAKQFRQARTSAGIPDSIVLYSARHTYGTEALEQTGNMPAVMRSMGHSDPRSMIRYQHPGIDALRIAVNRRNALRVGKEETYSR